VFLVSIVIASPIIIGMDKLVVKVLHHASLALKSKQFLPSVFHKYGYLIGAIYICLIGPVFEEVIFRFGLSFKKRHVLISVFIALTYFTAGFIHFKYPQIKILLVIAEAIITWTLMIVFVENNDLVITNKRKVVYIIISSCLFGLIHVFNYRPIDTHILWIYPFFVIPQFIMGWGITYIRLKNGFIWGILFHCLINSVSTAFYFIVHPI
jgi:membrane protease YdiL (CAAX protease family)